MKSSSKWGFIPLFSLQTSLKITHGTCLNALVAYQKANYPLRLVYLQNKTLRCLRYNKPLSKRLEHLLKHNDFPQINIFYFRYFTLSSNNLYCSSNWIRSFSNCSICSVNDFSVISFGDHRSHENRHIVKNVFYL